MCAPRLALRSPFELLEHRVLGRGPEIALHVTREAPELGQKGGHVTLAPPRESARAPPGEDAAR